MASGGQGRRRHQPLPWDASRVDGPPRAAILFTAIIRKTFRTGIARYFREGLGTCYFMGTGEERWPSFALSPAQQLLALACCVLPEQAGVPVTPRSLSASPLPFPLSANCELFTHH